MQVRWFVLLAATLCACSATPAGDPPAGAKLAAPDAFAGARELTTAGGHYRIEYVPRPDPIPLNAPFELELRVRASDGSPLAADGFELTADARMPAHRHGMNTAVEITRLPNGHFLARGFLLHMGGHWELYLDVTRDGATDRAQFDLRF